MKFVSLFIEHEQTIVSDRSCKTTDFYYQYAQRYTEHFAAQGVTLKVQMLAGSKQNLDHLRGADVQLMLVHAGVHIDDVRFEPLAITAAADALETPP